MVERLKNEKMYRACVTVTDEQYEFLKNKCINKSDLVRRLLVIRMEEPVLVVK